jgi:hypothetical protein
MRKNNMRIIALAFVVPILLLWLACAPGASSEGALSGHGSSRSVFDSGREG